MEQQSDPSKQSLLADLQAEHRALEARVRELEKHLSLTTAERVEVTELKKLKLRAKDRIRSLSHL